jgi:tRNA threonylcarbamoyladenosine biosynthesis protein TsaB
MNLLAFDTSTEMMSVAVSRTLSDADQTVQLWQHTAAGGAQTSAHLIPAIQDLMAQANLQFSQLDAIVFGSGPGSFTGLRTACATAQGLAFGANVKVLPVDTLLAVAEEARFQHAADLATFPVLALLDARMNEVYAARYCFESGQWTQTMGHGLIRPEELMSDAGCTWAGNVFAVYGARLPVSSASAPAASASPATDVARGVDALPTATALLRLAPALLAAGGAVRADQALPLYIRDKVAKTTLERAAEKAAL